MILNYFNSVKQKLESSLSLRAYGWAGQAQHLPFILLSLFQYAPPKNFRAKPKQADKKEGGLGEGIFARLLCRAESGMGWEAVARSASTEGQSRKFFYLKGKIKKGRGAPKNEWKNFLLCSPQGGRRRWVGSAPIRAQIVAQRKFERRSVIATRRYFQSFWVSFLFARSPRQRRGSLCKNPYISGLNQKGGQNQKSIFCPTFGGSWAQSAQSKSNLIETLLSAFALQFFRVRLRRTQSKFLIPRFTLRLWRSGQRRQLLT
ncbi:MAG: hypothetical protein KatS3mg090_0902 [Patescibacteria group bacterium]|nr:MAG: hypothetical protein KatS3mg090_0902 [Patescibacteria group bacterium]